MTRIAIVGGAGNIARLLHPLLQAAGHQPVALVRRPEQAEELEADGIETRHLDIENEDEAAFARAFEGCQAVVFAAGGGADGNIERKRLVDLEGSLKSIAAARRVGISRFVQVSAIHVDQPVGDDVSPVWRAYVEAKRDADAALRTSGLDWTIIRPGGLQDDPATGLIALADELPRGDVPRADVAQVIATLLDTGAGLGRQWELTSGDTPIREAIAALDPSAIL